MPERFAVGPHGYVVWYADDFPTSVTLMFRFDSAGKLAPVDLWLMALSPDAPVTARLLRSIPLAHITAAVRQSPLLEQVVAGLDEADERTSTPVGDAVEVAQPEPVDYKLSRIPAGNDHGHDFYSEVATKFLAATRETAAPAQAIAEANGVRVDRVHRWVARARSLGFLPATTRGRPI